MFYNRYHSSFFLIVRVDTLSIFGVTQDVRFLLRARNVRGTFSGRRAWLEGRCDGVECASTWKDNGKRSTGACNSAVYRRQVNNVRTYMWQLEGLEDGGRVRTRYTSRPGYNWIELCATCRIMEQHIITSSRSVPLRHERGTIQSNIGCVVDNS